MKKFLALLLAMVMVFALVGCGGNADAPASDAPATDAPASDAPAGNYDKVKLMFATTYNEIETSGQSITYFTNYITEKSGGAITFDIKWGGTVAGTGEELSFLQAGAFDMSLLGQSQYSAVFPLLNFPGQTDESQEKCVDYFNYIVYENEETSSLIQSQIESQGVKMLGFNATGANAFAAKKEITTISEMSKYKLGVGMNHSAYESLGFAVQALMPWDAYDSLSKGIVDIAYMSMAPMISLKWHEVAPYFVSTNEYSCGNYFTISLDRWNSFNDDTKALFEEAAAATTTYSEELVAQELAGVEAALTEAGGKLLSLNEEDTQAIYEALWNVAISDCKALAESGNCTAEMETVLNACAEYLSMPLN